jgi:hypothetical protein
VTEPADMLASAARATLEGAAEVTLSQSFDLDGMDPGSFRMTGTADFARGQVSAGRRRRGIRLRRR